VVVLLLYCVEPLALRPTKYLAMTDLGFMFKKSPVHWMRDLFAVDVLTSIETGAGGPHSKF